MKIFFILLFLGLFACQKNNKFKIDFTVKIDSTIKISKNLLTSKYSINKKHECYNFFIPELGFCKKTDNGIEIRMSHCFMVGTSLEIKIYNDSVFVIPSSFSCTNSYHFKPLSYKLTINSKKFNIGDTLKGKLEYFGFNKDDSIVSDLEDSKHDTLKINGEFEFIIKDKDFNYSKFYSEKKLLKILENLKCNPKNIVNLDLSYLDLKELPKEISLCSNLVELNLSNNLLNENSDFSCLRKLTKLKTINLNLNNFKEFPKSIFHISKIEHLSLGTNNIIAIPNDIKKLVRLKTLEISYNEISYLPSYLFEIKSLKEIWIEGNKISKLEESKLSSKNRNIIIK